MKAGKTHQIVLSNTTEWIQREVNNHVEVENKCDDRGQARLEMVQ